MVLCIEMALTFLFLRSLSLEEDELDELDSDDSEDMVEHVDTVDDEDEDDGPVDVRDADSFFNLPGDVGSGDEQP